MGKEGGRKRVDKIEIAKCFPSITSAVPHESWFSHFSGEDAEAERNSGGAV